MGEVTTDKIEEISEEIGTPEDMTDPREETEETSEIDAKVEEEDARIEQEEDQMEADQGWVEDQVCHPKSS